ncbi:MAG: 5-dehydro-4-deoxy-D-glucuronate isomerase [Lachnospiraceae bacterium]|nr:5-dehydro-4-deoxy-D-glucuronate isomerase [Lachnospiraceae bacterium]
MDIRYSVNPQDVKRYTTEELRKEFMITDLYRPDEVTVTYSHVDRLMILGILPVKEEVPVDQGWDVKKSLGTGYFLERREAGVFNLGGAGTITADGVVYELGFEDCLYLSKGVKDVVFASRDPENPARFYLASYPAHKACKTTLLTFANAVKTNPGTAEAANVREVSKFIHPDILETCQLQMGLTRLAPGNVWMSMPCHTHERRMEVYTYFGFSEEDMVVHFMGQPQETRHLMMHAFDAVISPPWSVHCGCGTSNFTLLWAMGGENQVYDDMDVVPHKDLR